MGQRYRHKRRGTTYEVVGPATLQAEGGAYDLDELVIYRGEDGRLWARLKSEFEDGRFEPVSEKS